MAAKANTVEDKHTGIYVNRELSWLKFNERVLEEAENEKVPLCERMSFLSIYQSNLDEFFMVRVGSLEDMKLLPGDNRENKTNMTPQEQIDAILKRVNILNDRKDGLKVHSKLCLITRKDGNNIQYITQVGTGNYNEKTSRMYTDLSLITANTEIGEDALRVFQSILIGDTVEKSEKLLVAPKCLQEPVLSMIDREIQTALAGKPAYIGIKINSLTDKRIIDKLVEASKAGVKIEMVVRGICCLKSGVPGKTENIQIRSIVGRYLEHSRIYIFGTPERDSIYISSADFMTRNTLRRVEVAVPVYDNGLKCRIREMFLTMMSDNVKARVQQPDGSYKIEPDGDSSLNAQETLFEEAYAAARS